ncbi:hypothetical protein GQ53DRAFT_330252 [Thozetella sp. PMI_491]|nr:hypothetical protein GQ53DRAFT_330252 [Thozetella sp. PMI_491]
MEGRKDGEPQRRLSGDDMNSAGTFEKIFVELALASVADKPQKSKREESDAWSCDIVLCPCPLSSCGPGCNALGFGILAFVVEYVHRPSKHGCHGTWHFVPNHVLSTPPCPWKDARDGASRKILTWYCAAPTLEPHPSPNIDDTVSTDTFPRRSHVSS